jgi:HAD superfamily hydrolase (TIGR01484 family)
MTAYSKQVIIFSLNGTLTNNGQSIDSETSRLLTELLASKKVAITSGCGIARFEVQLLKGFGVNPDRFSNLFLLPVSGTKLLTWKGVWTETYSEHLSPQQKEEVMTALNLVLRKIGWTQPAISYGSIVQDRGSQITFSGLGENAPTELKVNWDPIRELRGRIVTELQMKIPNYDIRIGGLTSIDITKRGVNKGYGIRKLEELLKLQAEAMIFVGDAIFSGGNDFPIKATGIDCIPVKSATETKELLKSWVVA